MSMDASLAIPVTPANAILSSRLWDIDLIINRALVYGTLAGIPLGLYVGGWCSTRGPSTASRGT